MINGGAINLYGQSHLRKTDLLMHFSIAFLMK